MVAVRVGLHRRVGAETHGDADLAVGEFDLLHLADFDAGHFHAVAQLQLLRGFEQGVDLQAALEFFKAAEDVHDEEGGEDDEGHEQAEAGFKGVFHRLGFLSRLKSAWRKSRMTG